MKTQSTGMAMFILLPVVVSGCKIQGPESTQSQLNGVTLETASQVIAEPCEFVRSNRNILRAVGPEIAKLCSPDIAMKMLQKKGQLITLESTSESMVSRFAFAGVQEFNGSIEAGIRNRRGFCTNFEGVRKLTPSAFSDVKTIKTVPIDADSCNFGFVGNSVLFFQPRFDGRAEMYYDPGKTIMATVNYLTKKVSLVEYSAVVSIAQQITQKRIRLYLYTATKSETKGMHSFVAPKVEQGTRAGFSEARASFN